MRFAKLASIGLLSACLAGPGNASAQCVRPAETAAFAVMSLKSQLMVTAITCQAQDRYNAFVLRFRRDLVRSDGAISGYFNRAFGGRGQSAHDDYITALANAQSQDGLRAGLSFCGLAVPLFDDAMLARSAADLATLARLSQLAQPADLVECDVPSGRTVIASRLR